MSFTQLLLGTLGSWEVNYKKMGKLIICKRLLCSKVASTGIPIEGKARQPVSLFLGKKT